MISDPEADPILPTIIEMQIAIALKLKIIQSMFELKLWAHEPHLCRKKLNCWSIHNADYKTGQNHENINVRYDFRNF